MLQIYVVIFQNINKVFEIRVNNRTLIKAKPTLKKIRMGKIAMKKKNYH